jgi:O-antigen/teichoic acid export membrane protein
VVANLAAGVMWLVPGYRPAAPLMHVMSVLFPLDLASELRVKMLERALDWQRLRLLHALGLVASAGMSIAMALTGWGAWSLLVPTLLVPLPFTIDLFGYAGFRPAWTWNRARYAPAWRFGLTRISSASLVSASQALESAVLVRQSGFGALGLYSRANGLANLACQKLAAVLTHALYPVLTRIEPGSDRYRRVSALMLRCVGWTVVPAVVLISVVADRVVRWLYGAQWVGAVPLVPWALAAVGFAAMTQTAYSLLLAYQEQRRCAIADALRLVGICAGLALLLPFGLRAYLAGVALTQLITLVLCTVWLYRLKAVEGRGLSDALLPPAVSAAIALLGAEATARGFGIPRDVAWMALAYIAVFSLVYVATLRVVFRAQLDDVLMYLPHSGPLMRALRLREAA